MDKKTLIFVFALTLALFLINIFFENRNQDALRTWHEQHKVALSQKEKQLDSEIIEHVTKPQDFPLIEIYADSAATQFLTNGIDLKESILTLNWTPQPPPATVYVRQKDASSATEELTLSFGPHSQGDLILYQKKEASPLRIADIPDFGTYYLQLVSPTNNKDFPISIALGKDVNGHFSHLHQQLAQLDPSIPSTYTPKDALVFLKTPEGYLPTAIYKSASQTLTYLDEVPGLKTVATKTAQQEVATPGQKSTEKFYVINTPYQQLVFSNYGGALAEINLPFTSKSNPDSVVKEIDADRDMVKQHPYNAFFPAHSYYTAGEKEPEEHSKGQLGGFYPLIRRDLLQSPQRQSIRIHPRYYALNIVSEYPEVAELVYEVKQFTDNKIVFEATQRHRRITKTYTIDSIKNAPYMLNLAIQIEGDSRGLWLTSGVPEVEYISGGAAPALKYRITRNHKPSVELIDLPQDSLTVSTVTPDWMVNSNGFLGIIQNPLTTIDPGYRVQRVSGTVVPSRLVEIDEDYARYKPEDLPGYITLLPLKSTGGTMTFSIFAGPFAESVLKTIDATYSNPETGYNPDFIAAQTFHGWFAFISEPFAKFLFILMKFFHQITGSWGFSIILLTIALRIMMYPLNAWSNKSMIKMQQIAPEVADIQQRYKSDPKKAQLEIMALYRDRGVNPASGCLPMLIQMPFLIGMFDLLKSTFELRGASFIPGWIDNLTAPDVLFSWTTPIPFIGNQFHLLPILLGVVMFAQQRYMSTMPTDPNQMTDQQRQQRAMGTIMAVLFTVMFYHFPSGLNIYWLSSMLLGIIQQWWSMRKVKNMPIVLGKAKTSKE